MSRYTGPKEYDTNRLCIKCGVVGRHYKDISRYSGLSSNCAECIKKRINANYGKEGRQARKYSMTVEQYQKMVSDQNGVCAICAGVNKNGQALAVDHDHDCCPGKKSCGKCVRSLLCSNCNVALGNLRDSADIARKAAKYLEGWNK